MEINTENLLCFAVRIKCVTGNNKIRLPVCFLHKSNVEDHVFSDNRLSTGWQGERRNVEISFRFTFLELMVTMNHDWREWVLSWMYVVVPGEKWNEIKSGRRIFAMLLAWSTDLIGFKLLLRVDEIPSSKMDVTPCSIGGNGLDFSGWGKLYNTLPR